MNRSGGTDWPWWRQRAGALTPMTRRVRRSTIGWYSMNTRSVRSARFNAAGIDRRWRISRNSVTDSRRRPLPAPSGSNTVRAWRDLGHDALGRKNDEADVVAAGRRTCRYEALAIEGRSPAARVQFLEPPAIEAASAQDDRPAMT
jgi:hypothetical protein